MWAKPLQIQKYSGGFDYCSFLVYPPILILTNSVKVPLVYSGIRKNSNHAEGNDIMFITAIFLIVDQL